MISIANSNSGVNFPPGGLTVSTVLTGVSTGSTIGVYVLVVDTGGSLNTTPPVVSDPVNGTYPALGDVVVDTTAINTFFGFLSNVTGGTLTITATYSGPHTGTTAVDIFAYEVAETTGVIGHTSTLVSAPGTGTDAIQVGPPTPNNTGVALQVAFIFDSSITGSTPIAGTGFTLANSGWSTGAGNNAILTSRRITAPSGAATATATAGADHYSSFVALFAETAPSLSNAIFYGTNF